MDKITACHLDLSSSTTLVPKNALIAELKRLVFARNLNPSSIVQVPEDLLIRYSQSQNAISSLVDLSYFIVSVVLSRIIGDDKSDDHGERVSGHQFEFPKWRDHVGRFDS